LFPKMVFAKVAEASMLLSFHFINLIFASCFFDSEAVWIKNSEVSISGDESFSQNNVFTVIGDKFAIDKKYRLKGKVSVYNHKDQFSLVQNLEIPSQDEFKDLMNFGKSVAMTVDNVILVAADLNSRADSCAVFVYEYDADLQKWFYSKSFEAPDSYNQYGIKNNCESFAISLNTDSLGKNSIIGFPEYNTWRIGAVIISNLFSKHGKLDLMSYIIKPPILFSFDLKRFGRAVHIEEDFAVISAYSRHSLLRKTVTTRK